jgi:methyltransferase (TIGR00027 family)
VQSGKPSRTALGAATHRAVHQILENGYIFHDPLASRILGEDSEASAREANGDESRRRMRMFIAVRTRFAEDAIAAAVQRGVTQIVVLGAGLDTFAYRSPFGDKVRIFEVDHPATQAWKRERLVAAQISIPNFLTFAPVDFERQTLATGLSSAGFDPARQTFFTWLGVVPYLTEEAVWSTLTFVSGIPGGAHIVFDYADPPHTLSAELRTFHDQRAARAEAFGEAWISYFEADTLRTKLMQIGFTEVEDLGPSEIRQRYFPSQPFTGRERGGHVVCATSTPRL